MTDQQHAPTHNPAVHHPATHHPVVESPDPEPHIRDVSLLTKPLLANPLLEQPLPVQAKGGVVWRPDADPDLRRLVVAEGRPLVLLGRSATSVRDAIKDVHRAAEALELRTGMDARMSLPDLEDLLDLLKAQPLLDPTAAGPAAGPRERFLLLDLVGSNVQLCVAVGSTGPLANPSARADATTGAEQGARVPYHLAALGEHLSEGVPAPAGIFAARPDRYSRTFADVRRFTEAVSTASAAGDLWIGDGISGRWHLNDATTVLVLDVMTTFAASEAKVRSRKRQAAALRRTGGLYG